MHLGVFGHLLMLLEQAAISCSRRCSIARQVEYRPASVGVEERTSVVVTSATAGRVAYAVSGKGLMPGDGGGDAAAEVVAVLGKTATKVGDSVVHARRGQWLCKTHGCSAQWRHNLHLH